MTESKQHKFKLRSPNDNLMVTGIALMLFMVIAFFMKEEGILMGIAVTVRFFTLLWMPKAAQLVNRNKLGWTFFGFLLPAPALIALGNIGYKKTPEAIDVINDCTTKFNIEFERLLKNKSQGEISPEQFEFETEALIEELQDYAKEKLTPKPDEKDNKFLNERLRKKGYVIDEDSPAFVEFKSKCPGCGTDIEENVETCPGCGLKFR